MYGYENIAPVVPHGELFMPEGKNVLAWDRLAKRTLLGLGVSEVYSLSFLSEREKEIWGGRNELVEVLNPISAETKYLRGSLLPKLVSASAWNIRNEKEGFLFEIGHVFQRKAAKGNGKTQELAEEKRIAIVGSSKNTASPSLFY